MLPAHRPAYRPLRFAAAFLTLATAAAASDYSDFRIPDHTWSTADFSFSASGSRLRMNTDRAQESTRRSARLGAAGSWTRETEPWQTFFFLDGDLRGDWRRNELAEHDAAAEQSNELSSLNEALFAIAEVRAYPGPLPFAVAVRVRSQLSVTQASDESAARSSLGSRLYSEGESRYYDRTLTADVTLGAGRVRDATGVYRAWLLERRWRESGAISRDLSQEARQRLAELFYLQGVFSRIHDRPDARFWSEVERIVREDGALSDRGVGAATVFRTLEPAFENAPILLRRIGWFVGPTLTVAHDLETRRLDTYSRHYDPLGNENRFSSHRDDRSSRDYVAVGARAEYHLPTFAEGQLDVSTGGIYATQRPRSFLHTTQATHTLLVAERWMFQASAGHGRSVSRMDTPLQESTWDIAARAEVGYYIQDRWRISLILNDQQQHRRPGSSRPSYSRQSDVRIGVGYQWWGALNAPRLVTTNIRAPLPAFD